MAERLNQPSRVRDEGLRIVNLCREGKTYIVLISSVVMVPPKEAPANSVPAAAVIRRIRALSGFIGFKGCVGGLIS